MTLRELDTSPIVINQESSPRPDHLSRLRKISLDGYWQNGVPLYLPNEVYDARLSRDILEIARIPWPITDMLWKREYPAGIPEDDKMNNLVVKWVKDKGIGILNGQGEGLMWNGVRSYQSQRTIEVYGDTDLAKKAKRYVEFRGQEDDALISSVLDVFQFASEQCLLERRPYSLVQ